MARNDNLPETSEKYTRYVLHLALSPWPIMQGFEKISQEQTVMRSDTV